MANVQKGRRYRSKSALVTPSVSPTLEFKFQNRLSLDGEVNRKSFSLGSEIMSVSRDKVADWLPESVLKRTGELQCLIIPTADLLHNLFQDNNQEHFSRNVCLDVNTFNGKRHVPKSGDPNRVSGNKMKPNCTQKMDKVEKMANAGPCVSPVHSESRKMVRSSTVYGVSTCTTSRVDIVDSVQLGRCVSLYERKRTPHSCSVHSADDGHETLRRHSRSHTERPHTPKRPISVASNKAASLRRSLSSASSGDCAGSGITFLSKFSESDVTVTSTQVDSRSHKRPGDLNEKPSRASLIPRPVSQKKTSPRSRSSTISEPVTVSVVSLLSGKALKQAWDGNGHRISSPSSSVSVPTTPLTFADKLSFSDQTNRSSSCESLNGIFNNMRVVPEDEDGYPEVRPSSKQKSDVFVAKDHVRVDEHAMSAPDSLQDDFDSLVEYLVQDLTATVSMVRSIYIWVTTQRLPMTSSVGFTQTDTPRGFLFNISEKKATYQELFAVLCRRSHIPCVIVHGVAKSICYDAGAKVSFKKGKNSWNAVLIDGEWRLVHPYWGASSAPGYCTGRWGEVGSSSERDANGNAQSRFALSRIRNEFYFLTDPDMFITKCFPENPSWQLLSKPLSKIEFEDLPFYQPAFYELKLKERLHENCVVHTSDGECNFEFTLPVDRAQRYKLSYTLHARRALDAEGEYDVTPLEGYSFRYRYEHTEYLQFRFPYIGVFKLNVFCKDSKCSLPSDWVVEYKIVCSKTNPNCRPYPITPAIGWGPNAELDAVGMHSFSHKNALVSLDEEPVTFVHFALPRDQEIDIEADLVTNGMSRDEMKSHVTLETEGGYAVIKVAPPGEGEYALQVFVNDGSERKNVCNYLMRRTKLVEDPELADIRSQLQRAVESGDAEALAHWISKFSERDMEDRGDLALARKKLHFAKLNRDLEEAIARKDLDLLEKALQSASGTSLRRQLGDLAVRAEAMRSRLRRFKRLRHEVLAMNQKTISEIRSYPKPPDAVHAVMAASFLLLGNQEQELRKWSKIQSLISKRGKDSLKRRVADFKTDSVQPEVLKRVNEILAKYDLETVQVASVGAATFFQWAFTMAAEMDEKDL